MHLAGHRSNLERNIIEMDWSVSTHVCCVHAGRDTHFRIGKRAIFPIRNMIVMQNVVFRNTIFLGNQPKGVSKGGSWTQISVSGQ